MMVSGSNQVPWASRLVEAVTARLLVLKSG
jgi:hypothetical protein